MSILIFLGFIFIIVGIIIILANDESNLNWVALVLLTLGFTCLHVYCFEAEPQAIDVYRGKTTLKITYKDSIPIDSVVVFK